MPMGASGTFAFMVDEENSIGPMEMADFIMSKGYVTDRHETWDTAARHAVAWHEELRAQQNEIAEIASNFKFMNQYGFNKDHEIDIGPMPHAYELDGYGFTALRSAKALDQEGRAMSHCVADYWPEVFKRQCWIYSVTKEGERVATLDVAAIPVEFPTLADFGTTQGLFMRQLKTRGNHQPTQDVKNVAKKFVVALNATIVKQQSITGIRADVIWVDDA
jgi:hypothetical protein